MPDICIDVIYSQSKTKFWCTAVNVLSLRLGSRPADLYPASRVSFDLPKFWCTAVNVLSFRLGSRPADLYPASRVSFLELREGTRVNSRRCESRPGIM